MDNAQKLTIILATLAALGLVGVGIYYVTTPYGTFMTFKMNESMVNNYTSTNFGNITIMVTKDAYENDTGNRSYYERYFILTINNTGENFSYNISQDHFRFNPVFALNKLVAYPVLIKTYNAGYYYYTINDSMVFNQTQSIPVPNGQSDWILLINSTDNWPKDQFGLFVYTQEIGWVRIR